MCPVHASLSFRSWPGGKGIPPLRQRRKPHGNIIMPIQINTQEVPANPSSRTVEVNGPGCFPGPVYCGVEGDEHGLCPALGF